MPGVLSASWDIPERAIGFVPEAVTGPASRACGGCHRANMYSDDRAGDLATFNAHTEAFGNFTENDEEDMILFGIIDKIMSIKMAEYVKNLPNIHTRTNQSSRIHPEY